MSELTDNKKALTTRLRELSRDNSGSGKISLAGEVARHIIRPLEDGLDFRPALAIAVGKLMDNTRLYREDSTRSALREIVEMAASAGVIAIERGEGELRAQFKVVDEAINEAKTSRSGGRFTISRNSSSGCEL